MADTLARSNSSVEERTSAGRDEGLANDTQGLGSQIVLSPDLFRPPPMVSVKLPKSVLVVFHLWRATKLPNFFQVKSRAGCSL